MSTDLGPLPRQHPASNSSTPPPPQGDKAARAGVLREVVGNPFRPSPGPLSRLETYYKGEQQLWRRVFLVPWLGLPAFLMATRISQERDWEALPVLADALEDAGCPDADLLAHLRGPVPHSRGCWALAAVLAERW